MTAQAIGFGLLWTAGAVASVVGPLLWDEPTAQAEMISRHTARLCLLFWFLAVRAMLRAEPTSGEPATSVTGENRWLWTLGAAAYAFHIWAVFEFFHNWSHAAAVAHVQAASGFGPGIWFSHMFGLLWTADAAWWWAAPEHYRRRTSWIDGLLHGYMGFLWFNATVVYETGPIRWAGLAITAVLLWEGLRRWRRVRREELGGGS